VSARWSEFTALIAMSWAVVTAALGAAWEWVWQTIVAPVIDWVSARWSEFTAALSLAWDYVSGKIADGWGWISGKAGEAMDWVSGKWGGFTDWLGEKWRPVGDGITAVWDKVKAAGTSTADVIKGAWDSVVSAIKRGYNALAHAWNSIPGYTVPSYVPGIGGQSFSLPKLPTLWHGGYADGLAVVGERGPEPLVIGGRYAGMVGQHGPEVAAIPTGGYVVPNLDTLSALPGLTRSLPASVAAAVSRSVPGYAEQLAARRVPSSVDHMSAPPAQGSDPALLAAVRDLAASVAGSRPLTVNGNGSEDTRAAVLAALRQYRREQTASQRYTYGDR
jgi:hypothetical protein